MGESTDGGQDRPSTAARPLKTGAGARLGRVAPLAGLAGRTAGEAVAAALRDRHRRGADPGARVEFHTRTANAWAERLGRSRGVLMKAGQILSVVIPESAIEGDYRGIYQAAFARLQDDAVPMPPEVAAGVLTAELGRPPHEVFAEFDPVPIAAASIGQVHAATLPGGRRVAVKVQYPGVDEAIHADLRNTELLATFLQLMFAMLPRLSRFDVAEMAAEVSARIGEEIDYRVEAANQRAFAETYRGHPFIRIPEVLPELSTRRVLTMEFVDGLRYAEAATADQGLRDRWGEVIFRFIQDSSYRHHLINTDPHPGNFLFHPDGTVSFLDFGCVKRLPADLLTTMAGWLRGAIADDADGLHRSMSAEGWIGPPRPPTPDDVLEWWRDGWRYLVEPQPFGFGPGYVADVVRSRMSPSTPVGSVHRRIRVPGDLTLAIRMDTGLVAVLGGLRASGPWAAILEEITAGGPPAGAYGDQQASHLAATR
jgi:predicted unusual protein kinase regulating ubiquinone biosynthesis (AarF/ABC1/UbiB family)